LLALPLFALVLVACGGSSQGTSPANPPSTADLAGAVSAAIQKADSAHYVVDFRAEAEGETISPLTLHAEGDASDTAFTAEGRASFGGTSFAGKLLAGEHEVFLNLMGAWYGSRDFGLADAKDEVDTGDDPQAQLWRDLQSPEWIRDHFDEILTGELSEGPELDAVATWQFDGRLNPDGIAALAKQYGAPPFTDKEREAFDKVAEALHVRVAIGREDRLPRALNLTLHLSKEDVRGLEEELDSLGELDIRLHLELSDYGKDVSYDAPGDFRPFEEFFSGFE
jgi:hypothetical protein